MLSAELQVDAGGRRLQLRRAAGCPGCSQAGACGSAVIAASAKPLTLPAPAGCRPFAGDIVRVELPPGVLLRLCMLVFLPLSLLIVGGAWLAAIVSTASTLAPDLAALAGAAAGLAVGCGLLKRYDSRFGSRWLRRRRWVMPSGMDAKLDS